MKNNVRTLIAMAVASTLSVPVLAAVTADEARQLGSTPRTWTNTRASSPKAPGP